MAALTPSAWGICRQIIVRSAGIMLQGKMKTTAALIAWEREGESNFALAANMADGT